MIYQVEAAHIDPGEVRAALAALAPTGPLSIARVARHLGTSPRSLQRRLAVSRVSFRHLVGEARLELARTLLRDTALPVQEIAGRVGYRTAGSFARAFGRWTGHAPRAYRRAVLSCTDL